MTYIIRLIPTLVPFCLAALLSMQTPSPEVPMTPTSRGEEVSRLRLERNRISARISILEAEGRNFLPR